MIAWRGIRLPTFSQRAFQRTFAVLVFLSAALRLCDSPAAAQRINLPPVTRTTWQNGARIVLMEYRRAPTLTVIALFPGGSAHDPADRAGTADLTAEMLRKGTQTRTAPQIAEAIEFLGGSLGSHTGADRLTVTLSVLAKDADAGLDLLADVLRRPTFPAEEMERERQLALAGLQSLVEDPGAVADRVAEETVYAGHPYGVQPTMSSLRAITRDDLLAHYRRYVSPQRMILVAVGDLRLADLMAKLRARFGDWTSPPPVPDPTGGGTASDIPPVKPTSSRLVLVDKPDAVQAQVRLVRTAFPRRSPDYMAAQVADTMLGGGFTSRLVEEIRVNRSLTYSIGSGFDARRYGGDFSISTFTKIETTRQLLDAVRAVLRQASARGFTPDEIRKVKGYMAGLFAIRQQTPEALAAQLAEIAFYGLPADYLQTYLPRLRAVTPAQTRRIAQTYFAPDRLAIVLVAPAAKVRNQLKGLGTVEPRSVESVGK